MKKSDTVKVVLEIDEKGKIKNLDYIPTDILAEIFNALLKELTRRLKRK